MRVFRKRDDETRPTEPGTTARALDSGETRAVMLGAAGLAFFLYLIKVILLPFIFAAIIAYVCTPLLDWLTKRTRWPRTLFAVAVFLILVCVSGFALTFAVQRLAVEARGIAAELPGMLENLASQAIGQEPVRIFGQSLTAHEIAQAAIDRLRDLTVQSDALVMLTGFSIATLMGVFLTAVLLFYFLASGLRVARGLFWLVPPHRRPLVARIWTRLDPVLYRYFVGVFIIVVYATVAAYVGLGVILGIKHAVLLAVLTGVLETIPFIGPTSAAVLAGLVSLRTATGIMSIFAYAIYATLLRLSIDQLVGPIVLGRAAHVHPALIIFCFLAGGVVFGIPGIILAVPVALLIKSALATLYGDARD